MNGAARTPRQRQAGFTLIELLVATTLLALLMTVLFGGLRTGTRVWEANDERSDHVARVQMAHQFVRARLESQYTLRAQNRAGEQPATAFDGTSTSVLFAGLLPDHFDLGGFVSIRVGLFEDENGQHLAVEWHSYDPDSAPPDTVPETQRVRLIERVDSIELAYFPGADGETSAAWQEDWRDAAALPSLVRVRVVFPDGDRRYWPDLVVRLPANASPRDSRQPDRPSADDDEVAENEDDND